jgi:anti-sigma regulatory factor (Ser/Thr protein kinase)
VSTVAAAGEVARAEGLHHEALLYAGEDGFLEGAIPFIRDGLAAGEPVLVMVGAAKIELLRGHLDGDADGVRFADMEEVGRNPARIIPAWQDFAGEHPAGRSLRGIGEPIWAARTAPELAECHRHEALVNLAFAGVETVRLLCPYDTAALDPAVIEHAHRTHPLIGHNGTLRSSAQYRKGDALRNPFDEPLPEPPAPWDELRFDVGDLETVRQLVFRHAIHAGISAPRTADLVLAANELAANSVRHAGGGGVLRLWKDAEVLVCEVRDDGRIDDPLVGRVRPAEGQVDGFGLWLVNQVCDLVQLRSFSTGSVARLHTRRV